jgi:aryl-alcohol dehydrogenase-like predicted oxidoreductase
MPHPKALLPRRAYKDDVELSILGLGGIVLCSLPQAEGDRIVSGAIDRGVNYFDVAPAYFDGEAELKLGQALRGRRDNVFYACKTTEREAAPARAQLERSLERAHTDHFDLYQFHAVTSRAEARRILAPGGAGETFLKARAEGKVRYLGASCHTVEAALELMAAFPLDSILFPVNYACIAHGFGPQVLDEARKRGIAVLALKALAHTPWAEGEEKTSPKCWYKPIADRDLARAGLYYTLSQNVVAAIPPGDERLFALALDLAADFAPLSESSSAELLASASRIAPLFRYPSPEA